MISLTRRAPKMNDRKLLRLRVWLPISVACVMIAVLIVSVSAAPKCPVVRLNQLNAPVGGSATAEFTLTNPGSAFISLSIDAPQFRSNGTWHIWTYAGDRQSLTLRPGKAESVIVTIPQPDRDLRIPFVWGWDKRSALQGVSPRLHARFCNLLTTLRNSRTVSGWSDPYGYLPDATTFYYITNALRTVAE